MPRYDDRRDDRHGTTRLYVGRLSSRTRSRDLEDLFSRYGRFLGFCQTWRCMEFSDPRDADDARYSLNGREFSGNRLIVEFAKGPRNAGSGSGGSRDREYLGRGPPPGSGRCFNCGLDGHWARDCKAGDWKNKCYRCGDRGHIERNCQNSPKSLKRGKSQSRSPSRSPARHGRSRSRSFSRSYSRSRSPPKREKRERSVEREKGRSRSPRYSRSPKVNKASPPPSKGRKHSPTPDEKSPRGRGSISPADRKQASRRDDGSDFSGSPRGKSRSPMSRDPSPPETNGRSRSPINGRTPADNDDDNQVSPRGSD